MNGQPWFAFKRCSVKRCIKLTPPPPALTLPPSTPFNFAIRRAPYAEGDTADSAYIRDYYLRDYLPCRVDSQRGGAPAVVVGTCADAVWAGGGWNASLSTSETSALVTSVDNWVITGASVSAETGLATIRFRRDVNTSAGYLYGLWALSYPTVTSQLTPPPLDACFKGASHATYVFDRMELHAYTSQ